MRLLRYLASWIPVRRSRYEDLIVLHDRQCSEARRLCGVVCNRDATLAAVDEARGVLMARIAGVQREKEKLVAKLGEADRSIEKLDAVATSFQQQAAGMWAEWMERERMIPKQFRQIIHEVEKGTQVVRAWMGRPSVTFEASMVNVNLETLRTEFTVALADRTPPELVADAIAANVRTAILKQWRHQSILNGASK
jgi:hypothetical protein